MVYIQKGPGPIELMVAKKNGVTRYTELHSDVIDAIKQSLYYEQGGLCAYCMRRLHLDSIERDKRLGKQYNMQCEHYIPQHDQQGNDNAALSIDFNNMLGVCPGGKDYFAHEFKYMICDQHRKNEALTVDPRSKASMAQIQYKIDGTIYSDNKSINHDLNDVLNLNCSEARLKQDRLMAVRQFQQAVLKKYKSNVKSFTREQWRKVTEHYISGNKDGLLTEYAGIIRFYAEHIAQK